MVQWTRWIVKHVADEMNVTWDVFYGWLYRFPHPRFNRSHLALGYVLLCGEFNVNFFYIFLFIISPEDQLIMDPFNLIPNLFYFVFAEPIVLTKEPTVRIQCLSGSMIITVKDPPPSPDGKFSGMIYPKGLSKNSTCLSEYRFVLGN